MDDYIYSITTYGHPELVEKAVQSLLSNEKSEIVDVKAQKFPSLAAAWNDIIARNVISNKYEAVIVMADDVECVDPRPTGRYLLDVFKQFGEQYNVIMTVGYDINKFENQGLIMVAGTHREAGTYCMCITKKLIDKIGWFDEQYTRFQWEDVDMLYRINLAGYEVASVAPVKHIGEATTKIDPEVAEAKLEYYPANRDKYIKKWGDFRIGEKYKTPYNK